MLRVFISYRLPPAEDCEKHHPLKILHQLLDHNYDLGSHHPNRTDAGAAHRSYLNDYKHVPPASRSERIADCGNAGVPRGFHFPMVIGKGVTCLRSLTVS